MGVVVRLETVRQQGEVERWRRRGYEAVDEMVAKLWDEVEGKDFEALSELLGREGQRLTGTLFEEVLKSRGAEERDQDTHVCEDCGRTLRRQKHLHTKTVESRHGEVTIERPYFYCKHCRRGYYPFDRALGIAPERKQYDRQRAAAELFSEVPHERASQIFERLTGVKLSNHCMHELAAQMGESADLVRVLPSRQRVEALMEEAGNGRVWRPVLVVAADGADVPTCPEAASRAEKRGPREWKEAKGFRIYLVGQERIEQILSWHQIATEEEFGEAIRFAATLIPVERVRVALVGDGAKWLWKHMKAAFPSGKETLDYYHCSERIHKVAQLQYGQDQNAQALWIGSTLARLNFGEVESVIWGLQRMKPSSPEVEEEIRKLIGYLKNNTHRINYRSFKRGAVSTWLRGH
jgi:hypothetical protein